MTKRLRKTLFLSETKPTQNDTKFKFQAPYIFYHRRKWREDLWYFNDPRIVEKEARNQGFLIC